MQADYPAIASCATLIGTLLLQSPKEGPVAEAARGLCETDLVREWPFGSAEEIEGVADLFAQARSVSAEELDRAFHHLFVGPGHLDPAPWGSVHLDSEAVVFGDSCIRLTRWMRAHGIALNESESREPADHIGRMLVLLGWLCENDPALVGEYLHEHLLTWAPQYFIDLEAAARDPFYRGTAKLAAVTLSDVAACF